jgi:hypothetical protein
MSARPSVQVSEVEDLAKPFQRHLLPFQSSWQIASFVLCVGGVMLLLVLLDDFIVHSEISLGAWLCVALCAAAGALPVWIAALPSRFFIYTPSASNRNTVARFIEDRAYRYGYKDRRVLEHQRLLSPKLPKGLVWKENRVSIEEVGTNVKITGPTFTIRFLRRASHREFSGREDTGR